MGSISCEKAAIFPETGGFSLKIAGNLLEIAIRLKPARQAMAGIEPGEGKNVSKTRAGKRRGCGSVGMVNVVSGGWGFVGRWAGGFMIASGWAGGRFHDCLWGWLVRFHVCWCWGRSGAWRFFVLLVEGFMIVNRGLAGHKRCLGCERYRNMTSRLVAGAGTLTILNRHQYVERQKRNATKTTRRRRL
jgi:hypothetical protein